MKTIEEISKEIDSIIGGEIYCQKRILKGSPAANYHLGHIRRQILSIVIGEKEEMCSRCYGKGYHDYPYNQCPKCKGSGKTVIKHPITIRDAIERVKQ